jgi:hypothetical protein
VWDGDIAATPSLPFDGDVGDVVIEGDDVVDVDVEGGGGGAIRAPTLLGVRAALLCGGGVVIVVFGVVDGGDDTPPADAAFGVVGVADVGVGGAMGDRALVSDPVANKGFVGRTGGNG